MKRYTVFIVSFIGLLLACDIFSGIFLTITYAPETSQAMSSTVNIFGNESNNYTFLSSIVAATFSFLISKRIFKAKENL